MTDQPDTTQIPAAEPDQVPAASAAQIASSSVKLTRRDMIEVEKVAGEPFGKLFPDGEATARGSLAAQYVLERKQGATTLTYDAWLDEAVVEIEAGESSGSEETAENPT